MLTDGWWGRSDVSVPYSTPVWVFQAFASLGKHVVRSKDDILLSECRFKCELQNLLQSLNSLSYPLFILVFAHFIRSKVSTFTLSYYWRDRGVWLLALGLHHGGIFHLVSK